jgi:AraC-like DNA-binding protein
MERAEFTGQASDLTGPLAGLLAEAVALFEADRARARERLCRALALLGGSDNPASSPLPAASRYILAPWQMRKVRVYIDEHLQAPIHIHHLAQFANLSYSHFCRAFKGSFGLTAHAYVTRRRVDRARHLLLATDDPLCHIAVVCGLSDQSHLSRIFRQETGKPPGVWRREMRADGADKVTGLYASNGALAAPRDGLGDGDAAAMRQ